MKLQRFSWVRVWGIAGLGAIALSLWQAGLFQKELLNPGGWNQFWRFVSASVHPALSIEILQLTWSATLKTLAYAVCGTCFSVLLGLIGGIFCSEVWWESVFKQQTANTRHPFHPLPFILHPLSFILHLSSFPLHPSSLIPHPSLLFLPLRALLAIPRAIHELIWGLIFINLFGLDPLVAVLAIAIPFGAITAKVFAELLDDTPRQPLLALLNSGVAPLTAFCYSLLPQAFLNLVSYSFYRFECSIRSAAVLGIIGAGGLGYEIMLSLQSLRYEQLWTFFYALFILNGCVDFSSAWLRQRLGCVSRLDLNWRRRQGERGKGERVKGERGRVKGSQLTTQNSELRTQNSKLKTQNNSCGDATRTKLPSSPPLPLSASLLLLLPFLLSFCYVGADFTRLWSPVTGQRLISLVLSCFPPDWEAALSLVKLAGQTIAMSVLAIALAATGGALLAFPAAHNGLLPGGWLNPGRANVLSRIWAWAGLLLSRSLLLLCRAVPAPIWALVVLYVVFPGVLPGAIALGLHNLGILGRLKAEVIENLDVLPLEALKAQGAPASLVFLYGVLPLTLPRFLAYDLYRWEVCMRETVIVGLVGAGGLGRVLMEQLSGFDYRGMVVTLSGFVVLTFLVDWLSASVRRSLR